MTYSSGPRRRHVDPLVQLQVELTVNLLRQVRLAKGLTLRDVATETGLSFSTIQYIEAGRQVPALDTMLILANFYGLEYSLAREIGGEVDGATTER